MKITKIQYSESVEVSAMPGKWVKVGLEADVLEGEHATDALSALKSLVKTWLLNDEGVGIGALAKPTINQPNSVIDRSIERLEILIDDCKTKEELTEVYQSNVDKIMGSNLLMDLYYKKREETPNEK